MSDPDDNYDSHYFEGVEKLLELWFRKPASSKNGDLRDIPRQKLEALLKIVNCEIISFSSNDRVDAYVLSESSMFVAERRFILKTCGTTTPLKCLKPLLCLVEQHAGFTEVEEIFYSRKNFKRPELQKSPHKSFQDEVDFLNSIFKDGVGYCLGNSDEDCWYLYTLQGTDVINNNNNNNSNNNNTDNIEIEPDQTLEVLMTDLDPQVMSLFTKNSCSTAAEATQKSGIDKILPQMVIDDYLFEPCGYSMNGLSKNGSYMTIHITPEPEFSYVSFETNVPQVSYREVIQKVLQVFRPGKFVLTLFTNKESVAMDSPGVLKRGKKYCNFGDLECREVQYCQLRNYDLSFAFYSKFPS
ncbi:S-adenosylmethionine decarboxylase proenzyme [Cimex lectularius]|uniref:S-adenosylmethionine decarboxylase proenzyme n=1 Tax=Cimex lectularius TaxID=79782 RepID=A0A8I6RGB5_CIMLE|nr:S-adenosylmethionine decarboxylase proenzyme [Cimex lectularius]